MMGVVAGYPISARFIGDTSLSGRPMGRVLDPLAEMGAAYEASDGKTLFEICSLLAGKHGVGSSRQAISQHLAVLERHLATLVLVPKLLQSLLRWSQSDGA